MQVLPIFKHYNSEFNFHVVGYWYQFVSLLWIRNYFFQIPFPAEFWIWIRIWILLDE
jgi:hypothetical protein